MKRQPVCILAKTDEVRGVLVSPGIVVLSGVGWLSKGKGGADETSPDQLPLSDDSLRAEERRDIVPEDRTLCRRGGCRAVGVGSECEEYVFFQPSTPSDTR